MPPDGCRSFLQIISFKSEEGCDSVIKKAPIKISVRRTIKTRISVKKTVVVKRPK
jgi:hypothetical protein